MEKKDIEALFPKKFFVTQEMIDSEKSIGTFLLKTFIPEELWQDDMFWGLSIGTVGSVKIKTEITAIVKNKKCKLPLYLDKNMEPQEIEFILRKEN
jgi:hypothetical protein